VQKPFTLYLKLSFMAVLLCQTGFAYTEIRGTITGTTNNVSRMYSKSNNDFAIQANLDYQDASGFYTGLSASNFNIGQSDISPDFHFPNQARIEIAP
jgi:uncharacterized protein (TIGR02001 family)